MLQLPLALRNDPSASRLWRNVIPAFGIIGLVMLVISAVWGGKIWLLATAAGCLLSALNMTYFMWLESNLRRGQLRASARMMVLSIFKFGFFLGACWICIALLQMNVIALTLGLSTLVLAIGAGSVRQSWSHAAR